MVQSMMYHDDIHQARCFSFRLQTLISANYIKTSALVDVTPFSFAKCHVMRLEAHSAHFRYSVIWWYTISISNQISLIMLLNASRACHYLENAVERLYVVSLMVFILLEYPISISDEWYGKAQYLSRKFLFICLFVYP